MTIETGCTTASVDDFAMYPQPCDSLCWAAVTLSVNLWRFPQLALTLCQVVEAALCVTDCCNRQNQTDSCDCNDDCNQVAVLQNALLEVNAMLESSGAAGVRFNPGTSLPTTDSDAIWSALQNEINAGRVLCCKIAFDDYNHYVVVWGYTECSDGSRTVAVQDPYNPGQSWDFDQFLTNYNYSNGSCCELITLL